MAIEQLPAPCWYAKYDGGGDQNDTHYETETGAQEACNEIRGGYGPGEQPAVETGRFPAPCWTAQCDGDCEFVLDTEDEGIICHCSSRTEAEGICAGYDWIVTRDGQVFCPEDAPECDRADLVVTEQVPGQLTLTGEDGADEAQA
jgi:hypothetical protein